LADSAGVDPRRSDRTLDLGIGGTVVRFRFVDMQMRLLAPDGDDSHYVEWEAEVGFFKEWKPTFTVLPAKSASWTSSP
jgi:hypothetical protein